MIIKKIKSTNISGFKLVVATVSTGNVAQLAADLFIESLNMDKYAMISNSAIIPCLGPAAFEAMSGDVTTASEMFVSEKDKLVILQTRTPLTAALLENYLDLVVNFAKDEKIGELVLITSSYSHEQHFIEKNPFEFIANDFMQVKEFSGFAEASKDFQIPGCGYAKKLFVKATESEIPAVILYKFVSEGDNSFDGIQLCQKTNDYFQAIKSSEGKVDIKIPVSWKFFGRKVNTDIY